MVTLRLAFWRAVKFFSKVTAPGFCIIISNIWGFQFLCILANVCCYGFYFTCPRGCEMVSHCGLICTSLMMLSIFHMLIGHLSIFFGKMSFSPLCPFLCCLFIADLEFFIDPDRSLISYMICKYLIPSYGLSSFSWWCSLKHKSF